MAGSLPRLLATVLASLAGCVLVGCVEITDLREEKPPLPPAGQVDTGWTPDSAGPDVPPPPSCTTDGDCQAWLSGMACLRGHCASSGKCQAEPLDEGAPCSDGDFRTRGDRCRGGMCEPGPAVCVCGTDSDCALFDDGDQCNGRLTCDGCACAAMDTPPGTPCDDGNPATVDDACTGELSCAGIVPCQCETTADCGEQPCVELVCAACHCHSFAAIAGLLYAQEDFANGIPPGWTAATDNEEVFWHGDGEGGLRATGKDGTYDHGPAVATLSSPAVVVPPGNALLRLRVGLFSGEDGCGDRLEIRIGDTLVDTICGPTAIETRTYQPLPAGPLLPLTLTFTSDASSNAGAGAFADDPSWIRVEPSDCVALAETVATESPAGPQTSPAVGASPGPSGFTVVWTAEDGLRLRRFDEAGLPAEEETVLDASGDRASVAGGWLAWERPSDERVVLSPAGGAPSVLDDPEPLRAPSVATPGPALAYIAETAGGSEVRLRVGGAAKPFLALGEPLPGVAPPRLVVAPSGAYVAVGSAAGVTVFGPGAEGVDVTDAAPSGSPDIAAGHGLLLAAWSTGDEIAFFEPISGSAMPPLEAAGARDPSLAATLDGWMLAWTVEGDGDLGVASATLSADHSAVSGPKKIAGYTFDDQDGIRIAALAEDRPEVLATWRTAWLDGDASGVVVRLLGITPPK